MTLVLVAHGTRDPAGALEVERMAAAVRVRLRHVPVVVAFADVREPRLADVLAELDGPCVVVPAFLASGYHVRVDVPGVVAASGRPDVVITKALGAHPGLVAAMYDRLVAAGWRSGDSVVMGAAGSSDPGALVEVRQAARLLAHRVGGAVSVGYVTTAEPRIADEVARLRLSGGRIAMASWLLAPGLFHCALCAAAPDLVAEPLGAHPGVIDLIARRYLMARRSLAA